MSCQLAVISMGDIRKRDKGLAIYLVERLKGIFSDNLDISFIYAGLDGEDLYNSLQNIQAKKILVLDTMRDMVKPGSIDYLTIKLNQEESLQELFMMTIGIYSDDWGKRLSRLISDKFYEILNRVTNLINQLLEQ